MGSTLRSLYICYLSLDDPLVETQVVAYLDGLARRGHTVHLLTYEVRRLDRDERLAIGERLRRRGIAWHALRYHKRPSLPATVYDVARGVVLGASLIRRHRLDAVHVRSHVPAAAGLALHRLTGARIIFDIRGLMAEEYVDAGRWERASLRFRVTKWVERAAIARAAGVVVLTERARRYLFGSAAMPGLRVIPCCADVEQLQSQRAARDAMRRELGLDGAAVLVYVGKFTGRYLEREMVEFFVSARAVTDRLHFLVLTQDDPAPILAAFARSGVSPSDYTVTRCSSSDVGRYLAAADLGISFNHSAPSEIAASPTKIGEYLGAGLPIVCSEDTGDVDDVVRGRRVGALVGRFSSDAYRSAAEELHDLVGDPGVRERCRALARERLSLTDVGVPRYDDLYRFVAGEPR